MKAYTLVTGIIFAAMCVAHIVFTATLWRGGQGQEALIEGAVAVVSGVLAYWAWRAWRAPAKAQAAIR